MSASLERAYKLEVTTRHVTITTIEEQTTHIVAYQQHGYQHRGTYVSETGENGVPLKWVMTFIKSTVLLDSTKGDSVPL